MAHVAGPSRVVEQLYNSYRNGRMGRTDYDSAPERIWTQLNPVECEAVVNALRRWQVGLGLHLCVFGGGGGGAFSPPPPPRCRRYTHIGR